MNTEIVAQMFKNYQSNVLFHLEGAWAGVMGGGDGGLATRLTSGQQPTVWRSH